MSRYFSPNSLFILIAPPRTCIRLPMSAHVTEASPIETQSARGCILRSTSRMSRVSPDCGTSAFLSSGGGRER